MAQLITREDVDVQYHSHDGFTLFTLLDGLYLFHRRFVFYTLEEAMEMFLQEVNSKTGKQAVETQKENV